MATDSGNFKYLLSYVRSLNSSLMNLYCIEALESARHIGKVFFPSSFYAHGEESLYCLEKLYSESLFMHSPFDTRIARIFPTYGPGAVIEGNNEKVTTAMCRIVARTPDGGRI